MSDLFDWIQGAMGRPDPRLQLANALGQGPGAPGSPQGPQPLAGGAGAPPAGGGPPGANAAPPGGPQQQQASPQPQILQTPPDLASAYHTLAGGAPPSAPANAPPLDLAQMYLAMQQRDQARQQFNSGLAGLSAAIYPGRTSAAWMKTMTGGGEDPNATMNSLMQIQQYGQQNQALQAFQRSVADYATKTGMTQDEVRAIGPQGMADVMSEIADATSALAAARPGWPSSGRKRLSIAQGKPIPWTAGYPASYAAWS